MPSAVSTLDRVREIAESWTAAWNARDLEALMTHYADTVTFMSPAVADRDGVPSGVIQGKAALTRHIREDLKTVGPAVHLTLIDVRAAVGVGGYTLHYRRETGAKAIVVIRLDGDERIIEARMQYHAAG